MFDCLRSTIINYLLSRLFLDLVTSRFFHHPSSAFLPMLVVAQLIFARNVCTNSSSLASYLHSSLPVISSSRTRPTFSPLSFALQRAGRHLIVMQRPLGLCATAVRRRGIDGDGVSILRASNDLMQANVSIHPPHPTPTTLREHLVSAAGRGFRLTWL